LEPLELCVVRINGLHAAFVEPQITQIDETQSDFGKA